MNVAIRVDASVQIGTGHVMRCLTLADALRGGGADVCFICRELTGNLLEFICKRGFQTIRLPAAPENANKDASGPPHAHWLAVDWETDASESIERLSHNGKNWDWLVVDHYALDRRWESLLRKKVDRIMVIDDIADRPHDCDLLLDQNRIDDHTYPYAGLVSSDCHLLMGPTFALLREEFLRVRRSRTRRDESPQSIFLFLGGCDPTGETIKALHGLKRLNLTVNVIVGAANPHADSIRTICEEQENWIVHHQVDNMAELMSQSDFAIGAGGTTTWERACVGLPSLIIAVAENQEEIARMADKAGIGRYLGKASALSSEMIQEAVRDFCRNPETGKAESRAALLLVDGLGVSRVVASLEQIADKVAV